MVKKGVRGELSVTSEGSEDGGTFLVNATDENRYENEEYGSKRRKGTR